MGKVNEAMLAKAYELKDQETRYDYLSLQRNSENLRNAARNMGLERFNADTASLRLLNYSDYLNQRYKANMLEGIIRNDFDLQVRMSYLYAPTSVQDFVSMIDDLMSREAPATYISTMTIRPANQGDSSSLYVVEGELLVTHPYYGEGGQIDELK
jgi:hypothetical protein